jgi:hypothetical protein
VLRYVPNATARGFELDETIFALTSRNLALLDLKIELIQGDYRELVRKRPFPPDHHVVVCLGPPWGDALTVSGGLDLGRTRPPVARSSTISDAYIPTALSSTSSRHMSAWYRNRSLR